MSVPSVATGFDPARVRGFVTSRHLMCSTSRTQFRATPLDVARRARELAELHHGHEGFGDDLAHGYRLPDDEELDADEPGYDPVTTAEYAGLLLHACAVYGLSYEELGDLADQAIAEAVRACTTDQSLPEAERAIQAANKLARGPIAGRLAKLAELESLAALRLAHTDWHHDHPHRVKLWVERARHLAGVCARGLAPAAAERAQRLDRDLKALAEAARLGMAEVDGRVRRRMERKREQQRQRLALAAGG